MNSLSILIPVYNEIDHLKKFKINLENFFKNIDYKLIFINDGSTDGSDEWLRKYCNNNLNENYELLNFNKNRGKGKAIQEALKIATSEYILFQDADLELDTNDALEMYKIIINDQNIECIFGSRYLSGKIKKNQNMVNGLFGKINSIIFNFLFNQSLSDVHCGSKIISKKVKNKINLTINDFGLEIDLASQIAKCKFEIYEYGISYFARTKKEGKKITWVDGVKSYYYLFKTRFIDNHLSTQLSIIYSSCYMSYVGAYFGMGIGKNIMIVTFFLIGLFIGLHRKIVSSSIIFLFIYLGSLFSMGNGRIYTVLITFLISLYLTKKIKNFFMNVKNKNKLINFFI